MLICRPKTGEQLEIEREREQALLEEIEKTEKERVKKKGKILVSLLDMVFQNLLVSDRC